MLVECELVSKGIPDVYDIYIGRTLVMSSLIIPREDIVTVTKVEEPKKKSGTPQDIKSVIKLKNRGFTTEEIVILANGGVI